MKGFKILLVLCITTLLMCMSMTSCKSIKQVPVETIEKIVYRDSLIYVHDSIKVNVPYETVKEVVAEADTSYLKTSFAESVAYLDTAQNKIYHTLSQIGEIVIQYDTVFTVQYIDKVIEKEVPVEVEVIKYKRDTLFWILVGWAVFCVILVGLKIFVIK